MRRVSPFFARRARPAAGLLQQARPGLNLAVQPAGPTPAARKATAPGTELLLLPANLVATTDPSMGKPRLFLSRSTNIASAYKDTSKSSLTAPPALATRRDARRRVRCQPASRSHPRQRQGDARDTRAKGAPQESAETARTTEGLPPTRRQRRHVLPPPRRRLGPVHTRFPDTAQHK